MSPCNIRRLYQIRPGRVGVCLENASRLMAVIEQITVKPEKLWRSADQQESESGTREGNLSQRSLGTMELADS